MNDFFLAENLVAKEAKFYHAINYADFGAYCRNNAILSRRLLSTLFPDYTKFFSDKLDQDIGVWDRLFGNLNDIGKYFWSYENSTPNAYGPITIVLRKEAWYELTDISITKRTITSVNNEQINHINIDNIFEEFNGHYRLKSGYKGTEVSASNSKIGLNNIAYILIDPININKQSLKKHVLLLLEKTDLLNNGISEKQIIERTVYEVSQKILIEKLLNWARSLRGKLLLNNEQLENSLPNDLKDWFIQLDSWKKRPLASWLTYIYNGTICHLE